MRKFLFVLLGLVVVLIGAALIVPFLVPTDTYKQQIAREVENATGRSLTIEGPLRFTILPQLGFEAQQVALANPPGSASPKMVRLKAVEVRAQALAAAARHPRDRPLRAGRARDRPGGRRAGTPELGVRRAAGGPAGSSRPISPRSRRSLRRAAPAASTRRPAAC